MAKSVPHFHPTAKSLIYNRIQFKREIGVAGFEEKSIRMNDCLRSNCRCVMKPGRIGFTYKAGVSYKLVKRVGPLQSKGFKKQVYQKKVSTIAIIAAAITAVVVTKIVLGNSSSPTRIVPAAAYPNLLEARPDDKSAEVTATLPLFHRLDENYMRGSQLAHGGIETLVRLGTKTIVDLRSVYDHTDEIGVAAERAGIRYYWLPMSVWNPPTDAQAKEFISVVTDKSKGPFFVFCFDGVNRTGGMSALYRIAQHKWTVERALKEMDEMGFNPYYYTIRSYVWTYARKFEPSAVPPERTPSKP